jgi:hypothetical protein
VLAPLLPTQEAQTNVFLATSKRDRLDAADVAAALAERDRRIAALEAEVARLRSDSHRRFWLLSDLLRSRQDGHGFAPAPSSR